MALLGVAPAVSVWRERWISSKSSRTATPDNGSTADPGPLGTAITKYEPRSAITDAKGAWKIEKPLATMFVWAPLPEALREMGSLEFSKLLLHEAGVAVSPGVGFGATGEGFVRFALVENKHRIRQAVRGIRRCLRDAGA